MNRYTNQTIGLPSPSPLPHQSFLSLPQSQANINLTRLAPLPWVINERWIQEVEEVLRVIDQVIQRLQ